MMLKLAVLLISPLLIAAAASKQSAIERKCVELHAGLGFDAESAKSRCGWKERREVMQTAAFAKCRADVGAATPDATIPLICFSLDVAKAIAARPELATCIMESTRALNDGFWYQEDFVLADSYQRAVVPAKVHKASKVETPARKIPAQPAPTFFQRRVLDACSAPVPRQAPIGARVLGQMHVHTFAPQKGGEGPIGGFSDLVVGRDGSLLAISDDLQRPGFGFFDWSVSVDRNAVDFRYFENRALLADRIAPAKEPQIDFEAMDVLQDGDLVLATEISPRLKDLNVPYESSYLMRVGADGAWKEGIPLRPELLPYWEKRAVKCTREHRMLKKPCVEYFQSTGFAHNKGIEALTLNGKKTHLVYVTEQPLFDLESARAIEAAHAKNIAAPEPPKNGTVLLTAQALNDPKDLTTYLYPLNLERDNGVVALRHYRDRAYLALERGYNPNAGEAVVRIYRFELPKTAGQTVIKTLVLDLADLKPSFTRGFESIDNFEGLAIGPANEHGTILFLVSDNNFNVEQRTMLLALEVSKELLP